ncbi:MAG: ABC transporter ATP-binding protein [Bacteroidetes bacterium]|jgi:lipopolysaccharide transport system ATP-binding protein|nr:ABC transporter ATP-binding protein [Bacteroidota bacterium]MDF1864898.1 ABC transporter ATP-binding protein [Saprospiraceae bacterium]
MKPILEVRNIYKEYKIGGQKQRRLSLREELINSLKFTENKELFWALQDVSFDVFPGEYIGIIGNNGAGKSTLLKVLSKITPPTKGYIKARGRVASLLEVGTGFHSELTGRENVYLNGSILGLRRAEIEKKFDAIVDFSGVERFLETPLKHYSTGMELRLAFAVAAHLEPEILLIDEVLAVGDAEFQKKCLGKMDEVSKSGRTVLFVSHNLGLIKQLCTRTILLHNGKVKVDTNTAQATSIYMNLMAQKVENYEISKIDKTKPVFFEFIRLINTKHNSSEFPHNESISIRFKLVIQNWIDGVILTLGLLSKYKNRIFTIAKPLTDWTNPKTEEITLEFTLPPNLFVPSFYSWSLYLHIPGIDYVDEVRDVCPFRIVDTGSNMAIYEQEDYGHFFLKDYELKIV